jgi:ribosomal protein L37E
VNWKSDLKLDDLDAGTSIEITCKRCGLTRYETQAEIMNRGGFHRAYLDQVEKALRCNGHFCKGPVRISLIYDDKNEGFVGGMA